MSTKDWGRNVSAQRSTDQPTLQRDKETLETLQPKIRIDEGDKESCRCR